MLSFVVVSCAFWESGVWCLSVCRSVCDILDFQPIIFPGICNVVDVQTAIFHIIGGRTISSPLDKIVLEQERYKNELLT